MAERKQREDYTIEIMADEHVDDVTELIYSSFTKHNPVWKCFKVVKSEVFPIIRERVAVTVDSQTSSVLICDNKIVAVQIIIDYVDFINPKTKGDTLPEIFKVIGKAHADLFKGLVTRPVKRCEICVFSYQAVHEDYNGNGFYGALNRQAARVIANGYEVAFAITTNPLIVGKVQENDGTSEARSVKFTDPSHPLYGTEMQLIEIVRHNEDTKAKL